MWWKDRAVLFVPLASGEPPAKQTGQSQVFHASLPLSLSLYARFIHVCVPVLKGNDLHITVAHADSKLIATISSIARGTV